MIRSVVKSFKVPGVEVVASRMSNEAALTRMIDSTPKKTWSYSTLVLDGWVDSNLPDEGSASGRFHHVQAGVVGTDVKQACAIYIHLLSLCIWPQEAITKYCAHLHHTLTALKRDFSASLVAPLPNSEQTNIIFSNHTYTKSTPNHIHHHYAPYAPPKHTIHTISSTAPTYAPHCHPWIYGQTPLE